MTSPDPATNRQPATGTWSLIHAERAALAADLAELTGQQWATRSLCDRFTVREVLAHPRGPASTRAVAGGRDPLPIRLRPAGRHAAG